MSVTKVWDDKEYKVYKSKWRNKDEYDTVKDVRERFEEMKTGRQTSCPWSTYIEEPNITTDSSYGKDYESIKSSPTGTNWADRWNLDYMLWSLYHTYDAERSNLRSPISFAPIEAAMAEFVEGNVTVSMHETEQDDFKKARIQEHMFRHWETTNAINQYKATSFHECLITGSTWNYCGWVSQFRDVELVVVGDNIKKEIENTNFSPEYKDKLLNSKGGEKITVDELKELTEKESEDQRQYLYNLANEKPLTKKVKNFKMYDDAVLIPESVFDIYIDNNARYMSGPAYKAIDLVKREIISIDQFETTYTNPRDPWIIKENVKKVVPAEEAVDDYGKDARFFELPEDIGGTDDKVEVLHYYNELTDKYIIVANDVLVRKGPLPFNHKNIPFSFHKFIEWPHIFYGVGIPVIVECLQSEDETLRNMMIDQLKLNINPPLFINTDIFQDIDIGWEEVKPGLKVEVSGDVGPSNIRWMQGSDIRMDYFRVSDRIKSDVIEATGINPIAYSVPKPNEPVRNNIMSMESTLKMLKKGIANWAYGYRDAARQILKNMQQKYPSSYIEEIDGEGNTVRKYKTIKTKGVKINANTLEEEKIDENQYGYLQLNSEYLTTSGDVDVEINIDTLVPMSKGLQVQKLQEAIQSLPPILSNPQVVAIPGIIDLVSKYLKLMGVGETVTSQFQDSDSEQEVINALEQNKLMMNGEYIDGIPGESFAHRDQHRELIMDLQSKLLHSDPKTTTIADKKDWEVTLGFLEEHFATDLVPKSEADRFVQDRAKARTAQPPMQGQPPEAGMPPEMVMPPEMMAASQGMPVPPQQMGAPGGVPMAGVPQI